MNLSIAKKPGNTGALIYIGHATTNWEQCGFSSQEAQMINGQIQAKNNLIPLYRNNRWEMAVAIDADKLPYKQSENCRMAGAAAVAHLNKIHASTVFINNESDFADAVTPFVEGMLLANYQFLRYKKDAEQQKNSLQTIEVHEDAITADELREIGIISEAVNIARDLINEPVIYLTAEQLAEQAQTLAKQAKFKAQVFGKKQIEHLGMGGLLAVNKGSQDPPTFSVLEWKPKNAVNKQPIVLVGKGVVYDTGGLSLKPTPNSMDHMKSDMAGAAAVLCSIYAAAKNKLPVHVIGLIPATDNRPGENAYTPGDVIKMHSGSTVEVLNTDAEGRMILADALSYAKQYKPELVIDIATLTGASLVVIGNQGMLLMGNAPEDTKKTITYCGYQVYERLAELPLWDEYAEQIKSDIADLRNIGGPGAGSITAAKFLEHFTDYPWLHIDMAPVGWYHTPSGYRLKNGSGAGVRLFYEFLKQRSRQ